MLNVCIVPSLPPETSPSMHLTNGRASADRESFIPPNTTENGMVEAFEDPWVKREDIDYDKRGRGYVRHAGTSSHFVRSLTLGNSSFDVNKEITVEGK